MAEALWFLANNFHWICGIYFRGKNSVCCQNCEQQQQQQSMPSRYNGFWLQFMDVALSLPGCPAPPSACLLSKTLLFSGRATKRRPVTTAETSRTTGNTDRQRVYTVAARKYMDRSIMQKTSLLKLFHCRASSASPIDFYANKILRLLLLFPLRSSSSLVCFFLLFFAGC